MPSQPVVNLQASDDTIRINESVILNWSGTRFSSIQINEQHYNGNPGHVTLSPTLDTQYVATATNASGQDTAIVNVRVLEPEPTISANISPQTIFDDQSSYLNWTSTDASHVEISNLPGSHGGQGSMAVSPTSSTTNTVHAFGDEAVAEKEVELTVIARNKDSCLSLIQQDQSLTNGIYELTSGNFYCDMSSGGWTLIFNQTYEDSEATGYFYGGNAAYYRTTEASLTQNYSYLGTIDEFRRNGKFEFKMTWPNGVPGANHWFQTNSINTSTPSAGYESISTPYTDSHWQGLERNCRIGCTFSYIDGSVGHWRWSFAIAGYNAYNSGLNGPNGVSVPQVTLYVK
ncbi:hypothetical protein AB6D11_00240 [Vibrio splendidus]